MEKERSRGSLTALDEKKKLSQGGLALQGLRGSKKLKPGALSLPQRGLSMKAPVDTTLADSIGIVAPLQACAGSLRIEEEDLEIYWHKHIFH
ncbi:hypothetical protein Tco_0687356 [Tanacetum coccineum]